tara:strand:+ start:718 stop:963 length:246 start_codon:yes stop_codon:yes gene_type:complete
MGSHRYFVDVVKAGGDPVRAYRKIKRKIKQDRFLEELRDRQYYVKPSEKKREKKKRARQLIKKKTAQNRAMLDLRYMRTRG